MFGAAASLARSSARFNGTMLLAPSSSALKPLFGPVFLISKSTFVLESLLTILLGLLAARLLIVVLVVLALDPLLPVVLVLQAAQEVIVLLVPPVVLVAQLLAALAQVIVLLPIIAVLNLLPISVVDRLYNK